MILLSATSDSLTFTPLRWRARDVLDLSLRRTGQRYRKRQALAVPEGRIHRVEQTTGLSLGYGLVFGSRHDSGVLCRTLEHRDRVSLLQRTTGLRLIPIAFLYGHSAFLGDPFPDTKRSGVSTAGRMKKQAELTLGDVVLRIREEYFGQIIVYVYQQALEKKPLFDILKQLKLSA